MVNQGREYNSLPTKEGRDKSSCEGVGLLAEVKRRIYSCQLSPVAELDSAGNVVTQFVGNYMIKNGNTYQLITDHLGSVRLVIDVATGSVAQKLDYDEFGNVISDSNPDFQLFAYAGGLYDTQTKLVRFGARDYEASSGRWTVKDSIGFGGGVSNLFEYALVDPINNSDPSGLQQTAISALSRYLSGSGNTFNIPFSRVDATGVRPENFGQVKQLLKNKCPGEYKISDLMTFSTSGEEGAYLGHITLKLTGSVTITSSGEWVFSGGLSALPDKYDFNPSNHRSLVGEASTAIGSLLPGKAFTVNIYGTKSISGRGHL